MRFSPLLLGLLLSQPVTPQSDLPSVNIVRLPDGVERPKIDGWFEDPAWELALEIGELRQVIPVAGAEGSEDTRIRLLYDDRSIFLAIECFDSDPAGIRATQAKRDANLDPDDRVEWLGARDSDDCRQQDHDRDR